MKEKLESELMDIAIKILNLKGGGDIDKIHIEVGKLYEKLTILKFVQDTLDDKPSNLGHDSSFFEMLGAAFNNKVTDAVEVNNKTYVDVDNADQDEIVEPVMEKIKDIVAQMPHETQQVDDIFESIAPKNEVKTTATLEDFAKEYEETPVFEPVASNTVSFDSGDFEKKSLNDKLKSGGLTIGLNDKLAFVKHLFNGSTTDYERVLSQLNTLNSFTEASQFIKNLVKPDYNNWLNKEDYEIRFMEIIESKYN